MTTSVDAAHKKTDTVNDRISNLGKKVKDMEEAGASATAARSMPGTSTTSRRSSTGSSPQQQGDEWIPRVKHWRGWAPYGSNDSSNISRTEAEQSHSQILDRVPTDIRPRIKFLSPFMKSHSVSAEIMAANQNDTKRICDLVNLEPIRVRNIDIKGTVETSPKRRRALRAYFEARDIARQMNVGYVFEECARRLEVWDSSACVRLGAYDRRTDEWIWDNITCATVGIKIPSDISGSVVGDGNATPRAEKPQRQERQAHEVRAEDVPVDIDGMDDEPTEGKEVIDVEAAAEQNKEAAKRAAADASQQSSDGAKKQRTLARSRAA